MTRASQTADAPRAADAPRTADASAKTTQVLGVSLSDQALIDLLVEAPSWAFSALHDVIDITGTGLIYLGSGRFQTPGPKAQAYLDPLFAAHSLLGRFPGAAALVSTSPDVEHPYNFARRLATLDHFTRGRVGAVVGTRDRRADRVWAESTPWSDHPTGPSLTADFVHVLRLLLNSWPRDSIIVDKEHGRFADVSSIVRIDHEGLYSVAGPLNAPSSVQGEPPLGLHRTLGSAETAAAVDAEIVLTSVPGGVRIAPTDSRQPSGDLFLVAIDSIDELPTLADRLVAESVDTDPAQTNAPTTDSSATGGPLTLRQRLGLGPRSLDLSDRATAFPA